MFHVQFWMIRINISVYVVNTLDVSKDIEMQNAENES